MQLEAFERLDFRLLVRPPTRAIASNVRLRSAFAVAVALLLGSQTPPFSCQSAVFFYMSARSLQLYARIHRQSRRAMQCNRRAGGRAGGRAGAWTQLSSAPREIRAARDRRRRVALSTKMRGFCERKRVLVGSCERARIHTYARREWRNRLYTNETWLQQSIDGKKPSRAAAKHTKILVNNSPCKKSVAKCQEKLELVQHAKRLLLVFLPLLQLLHTS